MVPKGQEQRDLANTVIIIVIIIKIVRVCVCVCVPLIQRDLV